MRPRTRSTVRLVVVDANDSVLLVRYLDGRPGRPTTYWATPGGGIEGDEDPRTAAARELLEETGIEATIGAELWQRSFDVDYGDGPMHQTERYFLVRLRATAPPVANSSSEPIVEHRWWTLSDLRASDVVVFPEEFVAATATAVSRHAPRPPAAPPDTSKVC